MLGKRFLAKAAKRAGRRLGVEVRRSRSTLGDMESFLRRLSEIGFRPTSVLDVGAYQADWSRMAQPYFPGAKFTLIEPQAEMTEHLEEFCASTPGSRWSLAAAGPEPGELILTVWPGMSGSSLLAPTDGVARQQRRVPVITIDSLFPGGNDIPQLAKLDIQGFELEALAGATTLFGRTECFIVEVNLFEYMPGMPLFADVVSFFNDRQYKVYDIAGYLRRPLDRALGQADVAFVLKGGALDRDQRWDRERIATCPSSNSD